MSRSRSYSTLGALAAAVLPALLVTGCATAGDAGPAPVVVVRHTDAALHEPVWSPGTHALLALTDDGRVARVDPGAPGMTLSPPLGRVGENVVTDPSDPSVAYVARPDADEVVALDVRDLRPVGALPLGRAPDFLATDDGSRALLALSEDRTTVSAVDLGNQHALPPQDVHASPDAKLDGPARGRPVAYHVLGPDGITHYKGAPGQVEEKGRIDVRAGHSAGDRVKVDRLYVAERDGDRLLAVETPPDHEGLAVVASADLGAPVRHVGTDETRVYAATDDELVVFATRSFTGYPDGHLPRIATIPFRNALPDGPARSAPVSGLAVGPERVWLTLDGQDAVVGIAEPPL
ncbi:hypothetical protein ACFPK1_08560 [Actinomycetospora rhizophila]|uniref:Uncharacterized protein n=1 Tax=Actinomycetospora rhizophila TaxID=1416876 RepID=A0ABV9ZD10_9PSEU